MRDFRNGELHGMSLRWCSGCNMDHAPLYPCESYPPEILAKIAEGDRQLRRALNDPEWCAKQIENGLPPIGIEIFKFFAGEDQ